MGGRKDFRRKFPDWREPAACIRLVSNFSPAAVDPGDFSSGARGGPSCPAFDRKKLRQSTTQQI